MSIFFRENEEKKRPGIYQRYSTDDNIHKISARDGYCAIAVRACWGPLDKVVSATSKKIIEDTFGNEEYDNTKCTVPAAVAMMNGGAHTVGIKRLGTGGKAATLELKNDADNTLVKLSAKYVGTKKISVSIQEKLSNSAMKVLTVYDGTSEKETLEFKADATDETAALISAVLDSEYLTAEKVIETSELAMMTHQMFQRHHIRPAVFNSLCSALEPISVGERAFMIASEKKAHVDGDVPVAIKNFAKKEEK